MEKDHAMLDYIGTIVLTTVIIFNINAFTNAIGVSTAARLAIVIVAGLVSRLFLGFFVNPVLYEMVARDGDVLQV